MILLQYIVPKFEVGRKYNEKEINEILKSTSVNILGILIFP
ncbi:DUF2087 domain-containing protein [Lysinibacillus sp. NPDC093692]